MVGVNRWTPRYSSDFMILRLEVCVRLAGVGTPLKVLRELATTRKNSVTGEESSHALASNPPTGTKETRWTGQANGFAESPTSSRT